MNLDDFIEEVKSAANNYSLKVEIVARTKNAVKIKVNINENIYIQIYFNMKSGNKKLCSYRMEQETVRSRLHRWTVAQTPF